MEQGRLYSLHESLSILMELLQPLEHLHQAGYVHRDVRIPNVVNDGQRLYLIDFGLSCRIGEQLPEALRMGLKEPESFHDSKDYASDMQLGRRQAANAAGLIRPATYTAWDIFFYS